MNAEEEAAYELGYKDGANSANEDWLFMLEEHLGLEDVQGPYDALEKLKEICYLRSHASLRPDKDDEHKRDDCRTNRPEHLPTYVQMR